MFRLVVPIAGDIHSSSVALDFDHCENRSRFSESVECLVETGSKTKHPIARSWTMYNNIWMSRADTSITRLLIGNYNGMVYHISIWLHTRNGPHSYFLPELLLFLDCSQFVSRSNYLLEWGIYKLDSITLSYVDTEGTSKQIEIDTSVTSIDLSCQQLRTIDLSPLASCRGLTHLLLGSNSLDTIDLSPLSSCSQLQILYLTGNNLESVNLDPLQHNRSLQKLYLTNNRIRKIDLDPLYHCSDLDLLYLGNNRLQEINLSPLQGCQKLSSLYLDRNNLSTIDLSPLSSCMGLDTLDLSNNQLHTIDLSPLSTLHTRTFKTQISIDGNQIKSIDITHFLSAEKIQLQLVFDKNTLLKTDSGLKKRLDAIMATAKVSDHRCEVILNRSKHYDKKFHSRGRKVQYVTVFFDTQYGVRKYHFSVKDTTFDLSYCDTTSVDLSPLQKVPRLTEINLNYNQLRSIDLSPLRTNRFLEKLDLSYNSITKLDLAPLQNCRRLKNLFLFANKINRIDLTPLKSCKSLSNLWLTLNKLDEIDISPLFHCMYLKNLFIDDETIIVADEYLANTEPLPEGILNIYDRIVWPKPSRVRTQHTTRQTSVQLSSVPRITRTHTVQNTTHSDFEFSLSPLRKLPKIGAKRAKQLEELGIVSLDHITESNIPKMKRIQGVSTYLARFWVLCRKALQENRIYRLHDPRWKKLHPEKNIVYDIETDLHWKSALCVSYWNPTTSSVEQIFEKDDEAELVRKFFNYLQKNPRSILVSYSGNRFDQRVLINQAKRYGIPIPPIFKHEIDLGRLVATRVIGAPKGGLKAIARHFGFEWSDPTINGFQVGMLISIYKQTGIEPEWDKILEYAHDDIIATQIVLKSLLNTEFTRI